ncbi:putative Zn cluster transcription factor Rds2 [Talaromyces proteolyticus]|uniref:Zn cluster transcription factor Rds2 n=1 Tax=Talaromyces proteolyticus TaxID=1131652 RepID=A0AAD4Q6V1_9EURO|nr:putative Zn cluster transcription factor Rds2 [Talaromyces proteolyticus]KAH8705702.1 putative Zn cluster transcription factor Rds2 [Talaromyces proteolyticus]
MTCDSDRPCSRCIKRNIGHLCHDEPREPTKKTRHDHEEEDVASNDFAASHGLPDLGQPMLQDSPLSIRPSTIDPAQTVQPSSITTPVGQPLDANTQLYNYGDWPINGRNQFQDMHTFHPSYMFNAPEVTNEYNLLGDFLSNSLMDDNAMFGSDDLQGLYSDSSLINMTTNLNGNNAPFAQQQKATQLAAAQNPNPQNSIQPPGNSSTVPNDKAREKYYLTAADPSGMDPPEERMNKLLKAKYEAGMLRPFNYVKGYARLNQYMEQHMQPALRHKILRQLDKFRPKFRERMQSLTDIELVLSEMWFERSLMEYDRVFASMAIPACCWRRTGEIFRGNKEMAELINVPIENLRDGKLALHQIITEDQLVSYWEKFGAIAFDGSQKAMLTSCTLKSPNEDDSKKGIPCCFSFTIRRDPNAIPALIVGNFLPSQRPK